MNERMQTKTSLLIETVHVSKNIASGDSIVHILKDINLSVATGESLSIIGASGSGKSTLLSLLAGLDTPSSGDIYFRGENLSTCDEDKRAMIRGAHIGFIFQAFQLLPSLSALENVMLPLDIQNMSYTESKRIAKGWLDRVGLSNRLTHLPKQLSGGEQQRVAIARAFATSPSVIFADEMTGNLDSETGAMVIDILFSLNQIKQTTLILVTHDAELAKRCDRQLILKKGELHTC